MARDLTNDMETVITADRMFPVLLFDFDFASGPLRCFTGYGALVYDGDTFTGSGAVIGVTRLQETPKMEAVPVDFVISGLESDFMTPAMDENFRGRKVTQWFGALSESGELVDSPYRIFAGQMDTGNILDDGETSTITIRAESDMIDLQRSKERRYTSEDQKSRFPGDLGMDFVVAIQDMEIVWKRPAK